MKRTLGWTLIVIVVLLFALWGCSAESVSAPSRLRWVEQPLPVRPPPIAKDSLRS